MPKCQSGRRHFAEPDRPDVLGRDRAAADSDKSVKPTATEPHRNVRANQPCRRKGTSPAPPVCVKILPPSESVKPPNRDEQRGRSEQRMDRSAPSVAGQESEQPSDEQNDGDDLQCAIESGGVNQSVHTCSEIRYAARTAHGGTNTGISLGATTDSAGTVILSNPT